MTSLSVIGCHAQSAQGLFKATGSASWIPASQIIVLFAAVAVTRVFRRQGVKVFKKIITCRYCTLVCKQSVLFVNVSMNGKVGNGAAGGMLACIEGLPPLPKSLSGLLNSSGGSWREMERMYVKKTMIQDDLSRGRNNTDNLLANKPANLDAALALLRKEMVRVQNIKQQLLSRLQAFI